MSNELVAVIITAVWLISGRGVNLCLVILGYYLLYIHIDIITYGKLSNSFYNLIQVGIDSFVIVLSCLLSFRYIKLRLICIFYAVFVLSSLTLDALMVFEESFNTLIVSWLHECRQVIAQPFDLIFAIVGSGFYDCIKRVFLPYCRRSSYNQSYSNTDSD